MESWKSCAMISFKSSTVGLSNNIFITHLRKSAISIQLKTQIKWKNKQFSVWEWQSSMQHFWRKLIHAMITVNSSFLKINSRSISRRWQTWNIAQNLLKWWPWFYNPIQIKGHPWSKYTVCSHKLIKHKLKTNKTRLNRRMRKLMDQLQLI